MTFQNFNKVVFGVNKDHISRHKLQKKIRESTGYFQHTVDTEIINQRIYFLGKRLELKIKLK